MSAQNSGLQSKHKRQQSQQQTIQPKMIIPANYNFNQEAIKLKKNDMKILQQYCEQNDIGVVKINSDSNQQQQNNGKKVKHQKTKSEGTTPMANNSIQLQFNLLQKQSSQNKKQIGSGKSTNPTVDYKKFLKSEKKEVTFINGLLFIINNTYEQYRKNLMSAQNRDSNNMKNIILNYPNANNVIQQFQKNKPGQNQNRSNTRKKVPKSKSQVDEYNDYVQVQRKKEESLENLIDGNSSINDSNILYEDQLAKNTLQTPHQRYTQQLINKKQQSSEDKYFDQSIYDQFIQGVSHNQSQNSNKIEEPMMYSYGNYQIDSKNQPQFIRGNTSTKYSFSNKETNSSKKNNKTQRSTTPAQQILNTNNLSIIEDKRFLMGRTPSPNFLNRINNLINVNPMNIQIPGNRYESLALQNLLIQNNNSLGIRSTNQSQSKRSNHQQNSNDAIKNKKYYLGQNVQRLNTSLKNKFHVPNQSISQSTTNRIQVNTKFKSGSITASVNTPSRSSNNTPTKQQANNKMHSINPTQANIDKIQTQQMKNQNFHQNKLKLINQQEERKALALVSSINSTQKNLFDPVKQQQFFQQQQHNNHQNNVIYQIPQASLDGIEDDIIALSTNELGSYSVQQQIYNATKDGKKKQKKVVMDGGTGSNGIQASNTHNSSLSKIYSYDNQQQLARSNSKSIEALQIQQYLENLSYMKKFQQQQNNYMKGKGIKSNESGKGIRVSKTGTQSPVNFGSIKTGNKFMRKTPEDNQVFKNNSQNEISQQPIKVKQGLQVRGSEKSSQEDFNSNLQQNNNNINNDNNRKNVTSVEPPKIATPSIEMFQIPEKQIKNKNAIIFQSKTPFEMDIDQKTKDVQKFKRTHGDDTLSILKQLQESQNYQNVPEGLDLESDEESKSDKNQQTSNSKNVTKSQVLKHDAKINQEDLDQINKLIDEEPVLMTEEDETQIRVIAADINEKAFYGKILKKTQKEVVNQSMIHLSPRSREIVTVMNFIKSSFLKNNEPPITTTDFYRIGKMLGRGAFGKVNLAMHKLIRKLVAIKSLNKECLTDEAQKNKLMKEVALLLKLRHNHVVKIYETIETSKHIIIVMELCAGGDLLNYVRKRRRLKEPYAKIIFKQIIDGLCYIHSKFIAHRDIKLDNILLDGKGNVKIADFGVSKQCQKGQLMDEQCGTPAYIAPEILKNKGYTFSVDIWSAGVVLFAMLYGTVPFKANSMDELHKLILKGKYTLKDDITAEARNLLRGLLEVNPQKRLSIDQIYRHKWLQDIDPTLQLFNDSEREMIKKEYTYNDPRRYNRNENEEPADCFTEHKIESVYESLKNATSKSVILAPFNSTQSQLENTMGPIKSIQELLIEKMMVLKFSRRCREIDRQYEFNNNGDLDNGVYHKYVYNSEEGDNDADDDESKKQDLGDQQLVEPMLVSTREYQKNKKNVRGSVENSFEDNIGIKEMQEKQAIAKQIKDGSNYQKDIEKRNKKRDGLNNMDEEMVKTLEQFQNNFKQNLDEEKVNQLVEFGYPRNYVVKSLEELDPNYCTAGYYLMQLDQNYC